MTATTLVTLLDDKNGALQKYIMEILPLLSQIYARICVVSSRSTPRNLIDTLEQQGLIMEEDKSNGIGNLRRQALSVGLESESPRIHFCEFDRLIVWAKKEPIELKEAVASINRYDFLVFGRTHRAFKTHPRSQIETESIVNSVCSLLLKRRMDITCASRGLSRRVADFVLKHSKAEGYETDAEWLMLINKEKKFKIGYIATEGLRYEDWLKHPRDVNRLGYKNWIKKKESNPQECVTRMQIALSTCETIVSLNSLKNHLTW